MNTNVVELCQELVALPSINPQDKVDFDTPYGEKEVADFTLNWLRQAGADVQMQHVGKRRMNVLAAIEGVDKSRNILLCAHMDTVGIDNTSEDPFDPRICDGQIYGRGTCDDKGPLAAMMVAFSNVIKYHKPCCNITLLATCGEEYDLLGAKYYINQIGQYPSVIVVGEPTKLKIASAHKGVLRLHVKTHGKSAHSSSPHIGKNAIVSMANIILAIQEFSHKFAFGLKDELLHTETLAITQIHGGLNINTVPDQCEIRIDWRILPGRKIQDCINELLLFLKSRFDENIEFAVLCSFNAVRTNVNHPEIMRIRHANQIKMGNSEIIGLPYTTDASAFAEMNIPTIIFGPGDPAHAHSKTEYICINELNKATEVYEAYCTNCEY